jgi:hypothetical protein
MVYGLSKLNQARRFTELAFFPLDETVPEAAAATLWSHTGPKEDPRRGSQQRPRRAAPRRRCAYVSRPKRPPLPAKGARGETQVEDRSGSALTAIMAQFLTAIAGVGFIGHSLPFSIEHPIITAGCN